MFNTKLYFCPDEHSNSIADKLLMTELHDDSLHLKHKTMLMPLAKQKQLPSKTSWELKRSQSIFKQQTTDYKIIYPLLGFSKTYLTSSCISVSIRSNKDTLKKRTHMFDNNRLDDIIGLTLSAQTVIFRILQTIQIQARQLVTICLTLNQHCLSISYQHIPNIVLGLHEK